MSKAPPPAVRDLSAERRIYHEGTRRDLPGGGWVTLCPATANHGLIRKHEQLQAAYRSQLDLAIDQQLPVWALVEVNLFALIGTVIQGWGDFVIDGEALTDRAADGQLHEDHAKLLLSIPSVRVEIEKAVRELNERAEKDLGVAEKNSRKRSAGN